MLRISCLAAILPCVHSGLGQPTTSVFMDSTTGVHSIRGLVSWWAFEDGPARILDRNYFTKLALHHDTSKVHVGKNSCMRNIRPSELYKSQRSISTDTFLYVYIHEDGILIAHSFWDFAHCLQQHRASCHFIGFEYKPFQSVLQDDDTVESRMSPAFVW